MNYVSPVKDTKFVLENLLNNPSAIENDLMNSILEEAGKLAVSYTHLRAHET